jgi:hypothetical protein
MTRGGHGLPKVFPGPVMAYPSTPCGRANPETVVYMVARLQGRQPATVFYPLGHPTPYGYGFGRSVDSLELELELTVIHIPMCCSQSFSLINFPASPISLQSEGICLFSSCPQVVSK